MNGKVPTNRVGFCKQTGAILPLFIIGLAFIVGMAGLAIDSSHSFVNVTRLQNALDAAALSAGRTLNSSSGDESLADAHGTTTFNKHLASNGGDNEMADSLNISFEYSVTLVPFDINVTANPSRYVRATVTNHSIPIWFARVLPGVGATTTIGTTAVSGPIPIGGGTGEVCDIAPMMVCGDKTQTPDDDQIFGLPYGNGELYCLKASSPTSGGGSGVVCDDTGTNPNCPPKECIDQPGELGPGNFQLIDLPECGTGGNCVRDNLAGKYGGCLANLSEVETEPGNKVGPVTDGFNTRFGQYSGNPGEFNPDKYPPDQYITTDLTHADYAYKQKNGVMVDREDGVADRRIMSVPIGDCENAGGGKETITVLGFGCYFMRAPTEHRGNDNWIIGELVEKCEASGDIDYTPDVTDPSSVNYRIILYNDPDNLAS